MKQVAPSVGNPRGYGEPASGESRCLAHSPSRWECWLLTTHSWGPARHGWQPKRAALPKFMAPSRRILHSVTGATWRLKCPASLPQFGTSLKGHPSSKTSTGLTKASLVIEFQFNFSLCSIMLSFLTMFFGRALIVKCPECKSFHQSPFSGVPEQRQCPTVFYVFVCVCFLIPFFFLLQFFKN